VAAAPLLAALLLAAPLPAALLPAALLLAGCGGPADASPQAQCQQQAYDDPTVQELMKLRVSTDSGNFDLKSRYDVAVRQATLQCLSARGVLPAGGVAPVQPHY
jgi:hypothetical protein